jgi:hypothetical protein
MKNYSDKVIGLNAEISKMVSEIGTEIIIPLCEKYDMKFTTGSVEKEYGWYFENVNPDEWNHIHYDSKEYCEKFMTKNDCEQFFVLAEVLELKIGLCSIGELVESYKPKR